MTAGGSCHRFGSTTPFGVVPQIGATHRQRRLQLTNSRTDRDEEYS
jgi:hypothetical protein